MRKLLIGDRAVDTVTVRAQKLPALGYAAEELTKYLTELTGVAVAEGGYRFALSVDPALPKEGFAIAVGEEETTVRGGSDRGVIYGVYGLLERYADARFFMPGLESFTDGDIRLEGSFEDAPYFEYRRSDWPCGNDVAWSIKARINSRDIPAEKGGFIKYNGIAHTMQDLTGTPWDQQPCLTDPAVLERAKKRARELLDGDPAIRILSVTQNDNFNYCRCERCAAVDAEEGGPSGTMLRFVNAVADDLREDYPDITVDTFAYQYTRKPPRITKPRDNVCIRLCSIEGCFSHPLADPTCPQNAAFVGDINAWNAICDNLYIWDYTTNYAYYVAPFPNFGVLRENMRFFADHGARGMYPEGNHNSPASGEFGELRAYLLARLMWDPYMSEITYRNEMDRFLAAYYGEGWQNVRAYIDLTVGEAKNHHMGIYDHPFSFIEKARYLALEPIIDELWKRAEEAAGDRVEFVRRSALQWQYIKLMLHPDGEKGRRFLRDMTEKQIYFSECRTIWPTDKQPDTATPPDTWLSQL